MISLGCYLFVFSVHVNILSLLHILQSSDYLDKQTQQSDSSEAGQSLFSLTAKLYFALKSRQWQ